MAAVGYTAVNRVRYFSGHPKVRTSFVSASGRSLSGVINANQYGSVGGPLWRAAANPSKLNQLEAGYWSLSNEIAKGILAGGTADPYVVDGGTFAVRTRNSGAPGGSFFEFKTQVPGSNNTFYGLQQ